MPDLSLEWASDLEHDENGDPIMVSDWDEARQYVERLLLTNPEEIFSDDGSYVPPDCIYHPGFGLGFRALLGHLASDDYLEALRLKCVQACMAEESIQEVERVAFVTDELDQHILQTYIDVQTTTGAQTLLIDSSEEQ